MNEAFHAASLEVTRREAEILDTLLSPVQCRISSSIDKKEIPKLQCKPDSKEHDDTLTSQALKNEVLKCMKKTSQSIDLSGLEDSVKMKAAEKFTLPEGFFVSNDETLKYLAACCRLAWQFNLVRPPMLVSTEPGAQPQTTEKGSWQYHPEQIRKGARGTTQRRRSEQPMVAYRNLPTAKVQTSGKSKQRDEGNYGKKRSSDASIVTEKAHLYPNNPRQDRGRSTGRSAERHGASVRSSSCEVSYPDRDARKQGPHHGPLDDVLKTLNLGDLLDQIASLTAERDYLKSEVSLYKWKFSNPKSLLVDERYLENVSETIRPSTLVERFKELESTEWLQAKETMDRRLGEDDESTFHLLRSTLMVAFQFAREQLHELYRHQNDILRGSVHSDDSATTAHSPTTSAAEEANKVPVALRDILNKRWRSDSEKCSMEQLEKKTMSALSKAYEWQLKETGCSDVFGQYLSACCRLMWQMNIMQPPMHVSIESEVYNESDHRVWYKCERSANAKEERYAEPTNELRGYTNIHQQSTTVTYGPPTTPFSELDLHIVNVTNRKPVLGINVGTDWAGARQPEKGGVPGGDEKFDRLRRNDVFSCLPTGYEKTEIVKQCRASENGGKFQKLWKIETDSTRERVAVPSSAKLQVWDMKGAPTSITG
ncbi:hypothetical protein Bbelb_117800 [Branchiostoma belcheri]|nr:hypothetical protein Bbelb_117800 [Branchiostoma belcheri]